METAWLKNFSDTKEPFAEEETNAENFLTTFLKSNPIKSVYNEPIDTRNQIEPLDTLAGAAGFDNIKGLSIESKEDKKEKAEKEEKDEKENEKSTKNDFGVINEMMLSIATSLLSLYLAYNLYFNLTVGDKKMIQVEQTLDKIPMKPATNWFVEIVKNINIFITTSIPTWIIAGINGNSYFKYRTVFVLFVIMASIVLKPAITNIIKFFEGLARQTSKTVFKYIFNYQKNNKIVSFLFFFFLTKSLYSMFLEQSAGPIVSFIVANPILFLIGLFIYVVVLYPITVPISTFAVTCLLIFYGFCSMLYYYYTETFDAKSPYAGVSSLSELFGAINNHMNFGPVMFEDQNNMIEKVLAFLFNDIHYLYFFGILMSTIPFILKMHSSVMKTYLLAIVGSLTALCGAFKVYGFSWLTKWTKTI
jgi:hypothetical protein